MAQGQLWDAIQDASYEKVPIHMRNIFRQSALIQILCRIDEEGSIDQASALEIIESVKKMHMSGGKWYTDPE